MLLLKIWNKPSSSRSCQNDSFIGPMTAGSGNPDFWWHHLLPQVKPVLWVPQSCLKMHWLGRNHCPKLADKKSFKLFNSSPCQDDSIGMLSLQIGPAVSWEFIPRLENY